MKINLEKKVGIFFIIGLFLLMGLVELAEEIVVFKKEYSLKAYFKSANGLRVGDVVAVAGVEVGKVKQIKVLEDKIEVIMRLDRQAEVRADSIAIIKMTTLLGGKYVDISLGTPGAEVLPANSTVVSREADDVNALVAKMNTVASEAQDLFNSLNNNQKKISDKISGLIDENESDIKTAIKSFSEAGPKLSQTLDSVKTVADRIEQGQGSLGKLLKDDELYDDIKLTAANIKSITAKVDSGEGTLGKLVNDPTLYDEATRTVQEVGQAAESVQEGAPIMTFSTVLFGLAQ